MTTIWMDPVELTASAANLAELAMQIQETMTGTRTTCSCEVPRSLVAWIDEELNAITVGALQVAVGYLQEAIDCRQRAIELEAEQSLAMAQSASFAVGGGYQDWTTAVIGGSAIVGGFLLGEVGPSPYTPITVTIGKPTYENMPFLQDRYAHLWNNPGMASAMSGILDSQNDMIRTTLAPNGLTYSRGAYVDSGGDRSTSLVGAYRDPVTGRYDLD
jgi:hypothetical protein